MLRGTSTNQFTKAYDRGLTTRRLKLGAALHESIMDAVETEGEEGEGQGSEEEEEEQWGEEGEEGRGHDGEEEIGQRSGEAN